MAKLDRYEEPLAEQQEAGSSLCRPDVSLLSLLWRRLGTLDMFSGRAFAEAC